MEHLAKTFDNPKADILGETLDQATSQVLENRKSPSRKVHELDNRGSHFYLALYWAQALASQDKDADLKDAFQKLASSLSANEEVIVNELNEVQGQSMDVGGYYQPNDGLASAAMRPSKTFNGVLSAAFE